MTSTTDAMTETAVTQVTTPTDRLLTAALIVAPLIYLAADSTYAARGWDDATAAVIHVLGAIAYGFVVLRVASWLPRASRLAATVLFAGLIGMAGNVAYGFDTIHTSLGDTALVDRSGAANLIKPLGLFFPLSLALMGGPSSCSVDAGREFSSSSPASPGPSGISRTSRRSPWR